MNSAKIIAKNTLYLSLSQIVVIILGFIYLAYIARYLHADGYGILSIALTFTAICGMITDFGLNVLTTREVAKDRSKINKYFFNVSILKLILFILSIVITTIIVIALNYPRDTTIIIYLVIFSVMFSSLNGLLYSLFQAFEKIKYQSIGNMLNSALLLIGAFIIINQDYGIVGIGSIYLIASLITSIFNLTTCFSKFLSFKVEIDSDLLKKIIIEAIPFGLTSVFQTIYLSIDVIILSSTHGNDVVGYYGAANRLVSYLLYIPVIINIAIFPTMSRLFISSENSVRFISEKYMKLMLILAFPMGIAITLLANNFISIVYGDGYSQSVLLLQLLIWSMVLIYANAPFVRLFESIGKQSFITKIAALCLLFNLTSNLLLIPIYSYFGASISSILTQFIFTSLVFIYAYKYGYGIEFIKLFKTLYKSIISSLAMAIFIIIFININILIIIPISMIIYLLFLYLLKGIDQDEYMIIKSMVK